MPPGALLQREYSSSRPMPRQALLFDRGGRQELGVERMGEEPRAQAIRLDSLPTNSPAVPVGRNPEGTREPPEHGCSTDRNAR